MEDHDILNVDAMTVTEKVQLMCLKRIERLEDALAERDPAPLWHVHRRLPLSLKRLVGKPS